MAMRKLVDKNSWKLIPVRQRGQQVRLSMDENFVNSKLTRARIMKTAYLEESTSFNLNNRFYKSHSESIFFKNLEKKKITALNLLISVILKYTRKEIFI